MDGILIVNKPAGITSHDVVDVIRRKFKIKKVGHTGTLDPMATGVLVILIGRATKLSVTFVNDDKEYIATLFLGKSTDTQDSTGIIAEERSISGNGPDIDKVKKVMDKFRGEIKQVPPMVSAKKHKGRKLYQLARRGETVAREPRSIKIHEIRLLDFKLPEIVFRVKCTKGTYVRTLCEDIGKTIGYPAHMSALVRTASGRFTLKEAKGLEDISEKDIRRI
ncbi:MAG: tRNA pseudouridine(55) synthase TruB [Candidatus Omnitrophica bacterium]|nr:tRNA pseudouridine(55) synthase TruB [Candidatus Omnitrophota bacterium]